MPLDLRGLCPLISVLDMPSSLAFYRDLLGFSVVSHSPPAHADRPDDVGWVWLRRGSAELMLNTAYDPEEARPAAFPPARFAAHGDTGLYIGAPDVDGVYAHLRARGVEVEPPRVAYYGMKQLNLRDPDGYGLCFQWEAGSNEDRSSSA